MKSKIALILCIIMCFSALVSCKGADDTSGDSSSEILSSSVSESETESLESSVESSDNSSEAEPTPTIPENAEYFTGKYYFPHWDGMIYSGTGLVEMYSEGAESFLDKIIQQAEIPETDDKHYYVGIRLIDDNVTDEDELTTKNERMVKQVGFIPTDEPYLNKDYVWNLYYSLENEPVITQEEVWKSHVQNLMPDVDLSLYTHISDHRYYGYFVDFAYDYTGYITPSGLKELVDNYKTVYLTRLPAPDDRIRFLTYINANRVGQ